MAASSPILTFKLPFPPSVNCLYSGNHRRFKSKRYTKWIAEAASCFKAEHIAMYQPIYGHIEIVYNMNSPDNRKRDLGNSEKALSDFLVSQKIIHDDSNIQKLTMEWTDDLSPGIVEVIIKRVGN